MELPAANASPYSTNFYYYETEESFVEGNISSVNEIVKVSMRIVMQQKVASIVLLTI